MSAIAIPAPWGIPDWIKLGGTGLLGFILSFTIVTSNVFQGNVVEVADYYVDCDTGNDTLAGTSEGTAWKTVERAASDGGVSVAAAGDIIWIKGTCPANRTVNPTFGEVLRITTWSYDPAGTEGNPITWKGWPGEFNQIGNGDDDDTNFSFEFGGTDYHRVEGLNFVGAENACIFITHDFKDEADSDAVGIEIVNNTFSRCGKGFNFANAGASLCTVGNGHSAIDIHHLVDGVLIDRNRFDQTGRDVTDDYRLNTCDPLGSSANHIYRHDHHINAKGKGIVVTNNVFTNACCGVGVKLDGYNEKYDPIGASEYTHIVINNTFGPNINLQPYDGCSGRPLNMSKTTLSPALFWARFKNENNIFIEPTPDNSTSDCDTPFYTTQPENLDSLSTCKNNIEIGDQSQSVCMEHVAEVIGQYDYENNVLNEAIADLEFVDVPSENYRIKSGSSAINAGLDEGDAPAIDFDRNTRTGNPDVGAFEQ